MLNKPIAEAMNRCLAAMIDDQSHTFCNHHNERAPERVVNRVRFSQVYNVAHYRTAVRCSPLSSLDSENR